MEKDFIFILTPKPEKEINMKRIISVPFFALMILTLMGLRVTIGFAQQSFDVNKAIAAGDHKGLAEYYKSQADLYRQKAASHDNMHADYKKSHVHYKGMENTFAAHCATLKQDALNTAQQYDALAKQEEKLATGK
jgi:hypothetical protein